MGGHWLLDPSDRAALTAKDVATELMKKVFTSADVSPFPSGETRELGGPQMDPGLLAQTGPPQSRYWLTYT